MPNKSEIGAIGERFAKAFLENEGYEIQESNWRFKKAEIDIIAKIDNILVFIEVKTRSYEYYGAPEQSITEKKEALLIDAAQRYMESIDYNWEIRFDIIAIIVDKVYNLKRIKHFKDAFFY